MKTTATALAALILLGACGGANTPDKPAEAPTTRVDSSVEKAANTERLNTWFSEKYEESLSRSPMSQTYLGRKTDYDKWDDPSDAADEKEMQIQQANVAEMREQFDLDTLTTQGQLSYRLAEYQLEQAEAAFPYRHHNYTFNQMFGVQSGIPAFLINQHRVTSLSDAEAYVARLNGVADYLDVHTGQASAAAVDGLMPPKFVYDYILTDARNMVTGFPFDGADESEPSPLYNDFIEKITVLKDNGTIDDDQMFTLRGDAIDALQTGAGPSYTRLIEELEDQQSKATTEDGAWKLPDGGAYYQTRLARMTTTDMTADEIHNLGLSETERIHGEMREIMKTVGFEGTLKEFFDYMREDAQFFKPNTDEGKAEYLAEATAIIDDMRGDLPRMFNTFPKADMIVKAVEPFREKSAGKAFYQRPAPDGSRPGTYYANLYNMADMPIYQMEALAFHEGIPGHHMQLAISQELEGIPEFRKYGGVTAYTEGWGLYSEYLPKEFGYYEDPYSDFGRLAMEMWRAARLVVDTGIHDKKWTREEAVEWLIENTPNPRGDAQKAIDRYIVMPGQATAYKIGMIKILALREEAKAELGDKFDIRDFHDVVLRDGPVPLAILEENVDAWVAETKAS